MKTLTVTEVSPSFSSVLDELEREQEEIVLVRNHRHVARLVPEPRGQNALQVFGDLHGTLDDATADALAKGIRASRNVKGAKLNSWKNPWAS